MPARISSACGARSTPSVRHLNTYSTCAPGKWCSTTCIIVNLYRSVSSSDSMIIGRFYPATPPLFSGHDRSAHDGTNLAADPGVAADALDVHAPVSLQHGALARYVALRGNPSADQPQREAGIEATRDRIFDAASRKGPHFESAGRAFRIWPHY